MNTIIRPSLLLLLAIAGLDAAELPKKAPLSRYTDLWTKSPFTTPPKTDSGVPEVNPFEDLVLKGVAPIAGGYLITLINKKNPTEAVPPIDTDRPSEYEVVKIERDPDKPLGTVVYLKKGDMSGTVTYDEKLSMPKPPATKQGHKLPGQPNLPGQPQIPGQIPGQPPQPGQIPQPGAQPNQPNQPNQPRARVVPPPTVGAQPATTGGPSSGSRGGGSSGHGYQRPSRR